MANVNQPLLRAAPARGSRTRRAAATLAVLFGVFAVVARLQAKKGVPPQLRKKATPHVEGGCSDNDCGLEDTGLYCSARGTRAGARPQKRGERGIASCRQTSSHG